MKVCINLILLLWAVMVAGVCGQEPRRHESHLPKDFLARFARIHDVCVEETGVFEADIKKFGDGEIFENPAMKCYMNCVFHEMNVVDDDGELDLGKLHDFFPGDMGTLFEPMFSGCTPPAGETQCDRAWSWNLCFKTNDPAVS